MIGREQVYPQGLRTAEVLVTVAAVPPGRHQLFVHIATDDPEYPEVRVPVLVIGPPLPRSAGKSVGPGADNRR